MTDILTTKRPGPAKRLLVALSVAALLAMLALRLPVAYRETMRAYPFPPTQVDNCQLCEDPDEIVAMNIGFR